MTATLRAWLTLEMMALYVAAPLGVYVLVHFYHTPLLMVFVPVALIYIAILTADGAFIWRKVLTTGVTLAQAFAIIGIFLLAGSAITWFAMETVPARFLRFPRLVPELWLLIMIFYPLISVTTQEIMFRVFFFHRYRGLFGDRAWPLILLNAVLFSFAHIIFQNWISIWMSFIGGLLFAWRYSRTGSFWAIAFEHAIYGDLIFTVGLGRYFYTGISNLNLG